MILTNDLFKEKPFPKWFSGHRIFKEVDRVSKVFPGIGLSNCEGEIEINKKINRSAKKLVVAVKREFKNRKKELIDYGKQHPKMQAERRAKLDKCAELLNNIVDLAKDKKAFVIENNGRISIGLPQDVSYKDEPRPTFRKSESLFRVYNKLNLLLRDGMFAAMTRLEDFEEFKTFSTDNVPNRKYKIVFSSDGADGAWDIGTMSMRGIESCQNWDSGEYHHCTIGSVVDPFVGIIYLTSGAKFNKYGTKMMKRCVVRFVIDEKDRKPVIVLDQMYPSFDSKVAAAFKKLIKEKTEDKFDVIYIQNLQNERAIYMPLTDVHKKLNAYSRYGEKGMNGGVDSIASYQDYHIKSKTSNSKDKQAELYEKNSLKKRRKFIESFVNSLNTGIKNIPLSEYPDELKPVAKKFKGTDNYNHTHVISSIGKDIAEEIVDSVDRNSFTNSNTYLRRIYYNYFNLKRKVCSEEKTKMVRKLNSQFGLKTKLHGNQFVDVMSILLSSVDKDMKNNIKELVDNKKISEVLPLP